MSNHTVYLIDAEERIWSNFSDFTESLTGDIKKELSRGNNPTTINITFSYREEGTTLLVNNKWYIDAIHKFANKHNIPLKNITVECTNAKMLDVYNKWHSMYVPDQDKINFTLSSFGFRMYNKDRDDFYKPNKPNVEKRSKKFNCLNVNMLPHRLMILEEMFEQNMLDTENNILSFHHFFKDGRLPAELEKILPIQFDFTGDWDKVFESVNGTRFNHVGDYSHIYDNTYFTITTESSECYTLSDYHRDKDINNYMKAFHEELFLTEKIFRPMIYWQPQFVQCSVGTLDYLKQLGFKTFSNFWNEDYDNEPDGKQRTKMLVAEAKRISEKSLEELHEMYLDMIPLLDYNRDLLLNFDYENIRSAWYKTS